jgi:hypothetical protein
MVSPVYAVEAWLSKLLSVNHAAPVLGVIFVVFLVVEPVILLGAAAWLTRALGGSKLALVPLAVRYSYALVPLGFGMWLAHYGFHFFTGILTIVPVTQSALANLGVHLLSAPLWTWTGLPARFVQPIELGFLLLGFGMWLAHYGFHFFTGILTIVPVTQSALANLGFHFFGAPLWTWTGLPTRFVQPIELGFLLLGFAGSLLVVHQLAEEDCPSKPMRAFVPWAMVCLLVGLASVWLMFQPMEMRAMLMGG